MGSRPTYPEPVAELPASVRTALWTTDAWARGLSLDGLWDRALPDVDAVGGSTASLSAWGDLGERGLFVALPHSGHPRVLPRCSADALADVTRAEECLFSPMLGGLLVPEPTTFGPGDGTDLDSGHRIDWTFHDSEPLAVHVVTGLDVRDTRRRLLETVLSTTVELEAVGGAPLPSRDVSPPQRRDEGLGLPHGIPEAWLAGSASAALVAEASAIALGAPPDGVTLGHVVERDRLLRSLLRAADSAIEDFTNIAVSVIAGWRPA